MPYLYCQKHGQQAIKSLLERPDPNEESSEYTKVICGLLLKDFHCDQLRCQASPDRCNQVLTTNSLAYLFQYFPNSRYESPKDFANYFNEPFFVAYNPEKEYSLAENYITMSEIKNVSPDELHNLLKKIWRFRQL